MLNKEIDIIRKNKFCSWRIEWINEKNAIESINNEFDQAEEWINEIEGRDFEIIPPEENKGKRIKNSKKAHLYVIYGIPSKGLIYKPLEFLTEGRGKSGSKAYLKKWWLRTSQIYGNLDSPVKEKYKSHTQKNQL